MVLNIIEIIFSIILGIVVFYIYQDVKYIKDKVYPFLTEIVGNGKPKKKKRKKKSKIKS